MYDRFILTTWFRLRLMANGNGSLHPTIFCSREEGNVLHMSHAEMNTHNKVTAGE